MAVAVAYLLGMLLGIAALFWLFALVMKENNIAKGKRSDFSSADRKKIFLAMGLSGLVIPVAFAGLWIEGSLADSGFGKTLLVSLGIWVKALGLVTLPGGVYALYAHKKNEEMLLRSDAQEQNKTDERNNNRTESDDGGGV